ncbi:MAG TPA: hypothetical protein VG409_12125 [Actinomycetota bacterium]|nr:hypothetical protein [Actinomycetota bacterium]
MNLDDRLQTSLEDRLRAAGSALKEGSVTQVDAATGLRAIILCADPGADDQAAPLDEPTGDPPRSLPPPAPPPLRRPQRLALAVNLLLVMALGAVLVVAVQRGQATGPSATVPTARADATTTTVPSSTAADARTVTSVPEACVETAELADEVISRMNRNIRDERLFLALRDYTIASQACRRQASP